MNASEQLDTYQCMRDDIRIVRGKLSDIRLSLHRLAAVHSVLLDAYDFEELATDVDNLAVVLRDHAKAAERARADLEAAAASVDNLIARHRELAAQ